MIVLHQTIQNMQMTAEERVLCAEMWPSSKIKIKRFKNKNAQKHVQVFKYFKSISTFI